MTVAQFLACWCLVAAAIFISAVAFCQFTVGTGDPQWWEVLIAVHEACRIMIVAGPVPVKLFYAVFVSLLCLAESAVVVLPVFFHALYFGWLR